MSVLKIIKKRAKIYSTSLRPLLKGDIKSTARSQVQIRLADSFDPKTVFENVQVVTAVVAI